MRSNGLILDLLLIYVYWYMCGIIPTYNFISILMKGLSVIGRMWIHTLVKNTREWCVSDTCEYVRGTWEWVEEVWGCIKTNISHARLCEWREKMKVGGESQSPVQHVIRTTTQNHAQISMRTTRQNHVQSVTRNTHKLHTKPFTIWIGTTRKNHTQITIKLPSTLRASITCK